MLTQQTYYSLLDRDLIPGSENYCDFALGGPVDAVQFKISGDWIRVDAQGPHMKPLKKILDELEFDEIAERTYNDTYQLHGYTRFSAGSKYYQDRIDTTTKLTQFIKGREQDQTLQY